jgi:hypothetical protein
MDFDAAPAGCASPERWKYIRGTRKYYAVSTFGRVRSLDRVVPCRRNGTRTIKGRILKLGESVYLNCSLRVDGKTLPRDVHVLVARAFVPNPNNKPEVNHKDGNKWNNHWRNLEWVTKKENMEHASRNGLASGGSMPGSSHPCSKLTEEIVRKVLLDKKLSNKSWASKLGVSGVLIGLIRRRKNWTHVKV